MGRKKRLIDKIEDVNDRTKAVHELDSATTQTVFANTDGEIDDNDDLQISIEFLLAAQGPDKEYLRLRNVRGSLPLSFYNHPSFQALRILNLRNCNIDALHPQVTQLFHLKHLDISGNHNIRLPAQLAKSNLTRLIYSPSLLQQKENHFYPYDYRLNKNYCGDKTVDKVPKLSHLAARTIIEVCSLDEIDDLRECLPAHLRNHLLPNICAECGCVGMRTLATRVKNAVIAFNTVPVHYSLCSTRCLKRIQEMWKLEEILNNEKRALRLQKFGRTAVAAGMVAEYAYA